MITLGPDRRIAPDADVPTLVDRVHAQGGVAIAAHPAKQFWNAYEAARPRLDGTELMHPVAYADPGGNRGFRWADMREFYVRAHAEGMRMTPIGSSDYHGFSPLGLCRTYVFATRDDDAAVVNAIREGRTVVYDLSGKAWGRPDLVAALEGAAPRAQHPGRRRLSRARPAGRGRARVDCSARWGSSCSGGSGLSRDRPPSRRTRPRTPTRARAGTCQSGPRAAPR